MEKIELFKSYDQNVGLKVVKSVDNVDDFINTIRVFRGAPYYEILDDEACALEYNSYVQNGIVLGCYINGEIAGINCILNESDKNHSIVFSPEDKIAYYSGLAVKNNYRKLGIGKLLVSETDKYLSSLKLYDYSYARVLKEGSMSSGIFEKNGFQYAYIPNTSLEIVDDVEYLRNTNVVSSDKRKYMVKKMSANAHGYGIK